MTPEFAAPEQMDGRAVSTATDVWALGAVLFELVTDQRAFPARGRTARELEAAVLTGELPRPSRCAAQAGHDALARKLRGDLDNIVGRALAREPERRYPSAATLAEDLRRHRSGLPVSAHPDSFGYRSLKFLSRHRLGVAAATFSLLALLVGLAAATSQSRLAREEAARQRATKEFLLGLFEVSDPDVARGQDISARTLLERGATRVATELAGEPHLEAEMLGTLGELLLKLGEYERALPLLERELTLEREIYGRAAAKRIDGLERRARLAVDLGDLDGAERLYSEALELAQQSGGAAAAAPRLTASLGEVALRAGQLEQAEHRLEAALPALATSLGEDDPRYLAALNDRGRLLLLKNRASEAALVFERVLAGYQRRYGDLRTETITGLSNLALARQLAGDLEGSRSLFEQVLTLRRRLYSTDHPHIAEDLTNLASTYEALGQLERAEPLLRQALAMQERLLGGQSPRLAPHLYALGNLLAKARRSAEAEPILRAALLLNVEQLGPENLHRAAILAAFGAVLLDLERPGEAESALAEAVAIERQRFGPQGAPGSRATRLLEQARLFEKGRLSRGSRPTARP